MCALLFIGTFKIFLIGLPKKENKKKKEKEKKRYLDPLKTLKVFLGKCIPFSIDNYFFLVTNKLCHRSHEST